MLYIIYTLYNNKYIYINCFIFHKYILLYIIYIDIYYMIYINDK